MKKVFWTLAVAALAVSMTACGGKKDSEGEGGEGGSSSSPYGPVKVDARTANLPVKITGDATDIFSLVNENGEATVTVTGTPNGDDGGDITVKAKVNYKIPASPGDAYKGFASSPALTIHFIDDKGQDIGGWCRIEMNRDDIDAIENAVKGASAQGATGSVDVIFTEFKNGSTYNEIFDKVKTIKFETTKLRTESGSKGSSSDSGSSSSSSDSSDSNSSSSYNYDDYDNGSSMGSSYGYGDIYNDGKQMAKDAFDQGVEMAKDAYRDAAKQVYGDNAIGNAIGNAYAKEADKFANEIKSGYDNDFDSDDDED